MRAISAKRNEPDWMLEFRLNAFNAWLTMEEPHWLKAHYDKLNYQDYSYYSAPSCGNCDETCASEPGAVQQTGANAFLSKEVEDAFEQLGVPVREGKEVAVDAIFDSVSVATTYRDKLAEQGVIFCSFGEAIHDHPELVKKYLGTVVPGNDNFFAALNAAVASDGTFIYVPKGVRCPMELSTYFRINAEKTGQFERTILVADEGSYVSYIEGCSAPVRDSYQLHAAVVEVIIHKDAEVKYSTVQNWFPCLLYTSIIDKFPKLNRFLTGYDLRHVFNDEMTEFDLTRILTGSEGTLAFITEARLDITPLPKVRRLVNVKYDSFDSALRNAPVMVEARALSVETVDSKVLNLAREDIVWHSVSELITDVPDKEMLGLNIVEFAGDDEALIDSQVSALCERCLLYTSRCV